MFSETDARDAVGKTLYDNDGDKIGKVGQVYLDDATSEPQFLTVSTGFFGSNESFVPAQQAVVHEDGLSVPFSKDQIKDAPNAASDGHLEATSEDEIFAYYGMGASHDAQDAGTLGYQQAGYDKNTAAIDEPYDVDADPAPASGDRTMVEAGTSGAEGHDTSGPTTDDAMTRSEEQLHVGTTTQQAGRARLRKYVTTEEQTVTVPVSKEYAVLETEAITDENAGSALSGGDITSEEHEVLLNEEVVEVSKTVKPVERVRLGTETRTEEQTVTEEVRKENIEVEGDVDDRRA